MSDLLLVVGDTLQRHAQHLRDEWQQRVGRADQQQLIQPRQKRETSELIATLQARLHEDEDQSRQVNAASGRQLIGVCAVAVLGRLLHLLHGVCHFSEQLRQHLIALLSDVAIGVAQHVEQTGEEFGQMLQQVEVGHGVEHADPTDQQLANERILDLDALAEEGNELTHVERVRLGHHVLHQSVQQRRAVLHIGIDVAVQLCESIEDFVEEEKHMPARDFGDIVQRLACIVANATLLVGEALQHGGKQQLQIRRRILKQTQKRMQTHNNMSQSTT